MTVLALPTRRSAPPIPRASVFVTANAGSGKTKTLIDRVARLLLAGRRARGDPLRHLHQGRRRRDAAAPVRDAGRLGGDGRRARWRQRLAELDERRPRPLPGARRPVRPRAGDAGRPEDPDHPRLLREAAAALPAGGRRLARLHGAGRRRGRARCRPPARESVAAAAPCDDPDGPIGRGLRPLLGRAGLRDASSEMFAAFEARRGAIGAYVDGVRRARGAARRLATLRLRRPGRRRTTWRPRRSPASTGALWRARGRALLAAGGKTDQTPRSAAMMRRIAAAPTFADMLARSSATRQRRARNRLATTAASKPAAPAQWLAGRAGPAGSRPASACAAARVAADTRPRPDPRRAPMQASTTAPRATAAALDFADLIEQTQRAADQHRRRRRLGALQAGRRHRPRPGRRGAGHRPRPVGHPARPDRRVLRRRGRRAGRTRTMFVVGDEKQSIYSFQGADAGAVGAGERALPAA